MLITGYIPVIGAGIKVFSPFSLLRHDLITQSDTVGSTNPEVAAAHHFREKHVLSRVQVTSCMATEGSLLVPSMSQTESSHLLGSSVVLDAEGSRASDTEALPCEREDGVLLVSAIQDSFTATGSHSGRNRADG